MKIPSIACLFLIGFLVGGCATQPLEGGFQDVCDKLVAMGPAERASNVGANGKRYQDVYGIYYDPLTDALYTKTASGDRDYILKGDLIRATFLIDNRKDAAKTKPAPDTFGE